MEAPQQQISEIPRSERLPFDAEFFQRVEKFTAEVIEKLPELHGVAIIPIWANQPENTPPGILRLRDAQPPYMASLLRLLTRMAVFNVEIQKDLLNQIKMFDNYAAQLADTIRQKTEELNNLVKSEPSTSNEQ